jgi:hypothetical protein
MSSDVLGDCAVCPWRLARVWCWAGENFWREIFFLGMLSISICTLPRSPLSSSIIMVILFGSILVI